MQIGSCRKRPTAMLQVCARLQSPTEFPHPPGGARCRFIDGLLGIATAGLANRKRDRLILKGAIWFQVIYVKKSRPSNARGTNDFAFADSTESARPLYLRTSIRRSS